MLDAQEVGGEEGTVIVYLSEELSKVSRNFLRVVGFHSLTVPSPDADASSFPSDAKATAQTSPV